MAGLTITLITFTLGTVLALLSHFGFFKPSMPLPMLQRKCGTTSIEPTLNEMNLNTLKAPKIMFGEEVRPNSFPWIVSLRAKKYDNAHFCGGVIIEHQYVLTAAHCVYSQKVQDISVIVGLHNRNLSQYDEDFIKNNTYQVSHFLYHHFYSDLFKSNDIAVIKLETPINFSQNASAICLPGSANDDVIVLEKNLVAAGWGSINGKNAQNFLANKLQQTSLKVVNDTRICEKLPYFTEESMYCAIDKNTTQHSNVCYGDSGGPLMHVSNGKWYTFGITSMVFADKVTRYCDSKEPSYFTKVAAYLDWIDEAIQFLQKS